MIWSALTLAAPPCGTLDDYEVAALLSTLDDPGRACLLDNASDPQRALGILLQDAEARGAAEDWAAAADKLSAMSPDDAVFHLRVAEYFATEGREDHERVLAAAQVVIDNAETAWPVEDDRVPNRQRAHRLQSISAYRIWEATKAGFEAKPRTASKKDFKKATQSLSEISRAWYLRSVANGWIPDQGLMLCKLSGADEAWCKSAE